MIKRAEVTLSLELSKQIDYANCSDAEKEFITLLAAVYAICYLTGSSAVSLSFSVGDQNGNVMGNVIPLDAVGKVRPHLNSLKQPTVGGI
jgi:hypothetical protein